MRMRLAVVAALSVSALLAVGLATAEDRTAPATGTDTTAVPRTTPAVTHRPPRPLVIGLTADVVDKMLEETRVLGRWACILAGLSLVGVIWVGWSMRTLAQNQVALGKLIEQAMQPK